MGRRPRWRVGQWSGLRPDLRSRLGPDRRPRLGPDGRGRRGRPATRGNGQRRAGGHRRREHGNQPAFPRGHSSEDTEIHVLFLFSPLIPAFSAVPDTNLRLTRANAHRQDRQFPRPGRRAIRLPPASAAADLADRLARQAPRPFGEKFLTCRTSEAFRPRVRCLRSGPWAAPMRLPDLTMCGRRSRGNTGLSRSAGR